MAYFYSDTKNAEQWLNILSQFNNTYALRRFFGHWKNSYYSLSHAWISLQLPNEASKKIALYDIAGQTYVCSIMNWHWNLISVWSSLQTKKMKYGRQQSIMLIQYSKELEYHIHSICSSNRIPSGGAIQTNRELDISVQLWWKWINIRN